MKPQKTKTTATTTKLWPLNDGKGKTIGIYV